MNLKTERFEMRLDQSILDKIDSWRGKQDDYPSRAEAVRRLIEVGLASTGDTTLNLKESEKLIVSLLCDLHKGLSVKGELDPNFIQDAMYGGHYWGLKWQYPGLFHGHHDDEKVLSETVDILDMWYFLERAYASLSKKDKDSVKVNAKSGKDIKFDGFDGNNETEYLSIARFLIEKLGRFSEFKNRGDLNSHYPTLGVYHRMLSVFLPIRSKLVGRDLDAKEIVEILNERVHPTMREKVN